MTLQEICKRLEVSLKSGGAHIDLGTSYTCAICYVEYPGSEVACLGCGHVFCKSCWRSWLKTNIKEGLAALYLRCPLPDCGVQVDISFVESIVDSELFQRYSIFILKSYVENNALLRWCTAPGCKYAVSVAPGMRGQIRRTGIRCRCGYQFCYECGSDLHVPALCEHIREWNKRLGDESLTGLWIIANTKVCPKCSSPIEKNGGCNHITCRKCSHEFCWICMGPWSEHGSHTGGFYSCNRYDPARDSGNTTVSDARAKMQRYRHYHTRYKTHESNLKQNVRFTSQIEAVAKSVQDNTPGYVDVSTLYSAAEQLIACRRALMYSYVYAFYLQETPAKRLFELYQAKLEVFTEELAQLFVEYETSKRKFSMPELQRRTAIARARLEGLMKGVSLEGDPLTSDTKLFHTNPFDGM